MPITNLNFRVLVNKHTKDIDKIEDTLNPDSNGVAYLREAISEEDQSIEITSNGTPLTEGSDFIVDYTAAIVTFDTIPANPIVAKYFGVGSIIWAQDVTEVQNAIKVINRDAFNKNGDTLNGELNVNGFNIKNVSTINGINLWNHNHVNGNGALIPSGGIENDAIITSKIKDLNVTNEKLSSKENEGIAAVGTYNIQNEAVTSTELANNSVTNNKIQGGTINASKLNIKSVIDVLYPVGSIYIGTQNTCPLAVSGTRWEPISDGYYLQQKLPNKSLGSEVLAGLPDIKTSEQVILAWHNNTTSFIDGPINKIDPGSYSINHGLDSYNYTGLAFFKASLANPIYGGSDTVQTNAIEVNIWKRVE